MRRNGFSPLIFIFLFIILGGGAFSVILSLIPIFIPLFIFYLIIKSSDKKNNHHNIKYNNSYRRQRNTTNVNPYSSKVDKQFVSIKDKDLIDKKLSEYYKEHYKLPIFEDIYLVTKNGSYTSFEELYISKNEETIISLEEFGNNYPATYAEIISLLKAFTKEDTKIMAQEVKKPKIKNEEQLSDASKYIEKINSLNIAIPQVEITNSLYQTCALLKQIDIASKGTKDDTKISKLYDYYLPILVNILSNYKELMNSGAKGEEFKKCEAQLIKTIILINEALKTINNTMHEDDYMNLTADISTLQSLLKKDGLVKEGSIFEGKEND